MRRLRKTAKSRLRSWPIGLYRVAGDSMLPTLESGDLLMGWRLGRPRVGQVVVARYGRPLVKRVVRLDQSLVWLEGDNPAASTDSRSFGYLNTDKLEAVIICRIALGKFGIKPKAPWLSFRLR